jgi:hypothetical protein
MRASLLILVAVAAQVVVLGPLEVAARLFFPEFRGHVTSETRTLGAAIHHVDVRGIRVRVSHEGYRSTTTGPVVVILGDSISNGFGMAFEDIYWVTPQRRLESAEADTRIVSLSGHGYGLPDSPHAIRRLAAQEDVRIRFVLYQFNFNDVAPGQEAGLFRAEADGLVQSEHFKRIARWRYEHLNRSVFVRVLQHYLGIAVRRRDGSCEDRGLDALGSYTWAFGSEGYRTESERYWQEIEEDLGRIRALTDDVGAGFALWVSPLLFDIDTERVHPFYNAYELDFECATIDAHARLREVAARLGIRVLDPAEYVRASFEMRVREGNFVPYFFTADANHFTPVVSAYIADFLMAELRDEFPSRQLAHDARSPRSDP